MTPADRLFVNKLNINISMKKLISLILVVLGTAIITPSCKKDHHYDMDNQAFVTQASSSNLFEIAAGNLAVQKSTNANITAFGNHMISDHSKTATEMSALASQKGWAVSTSMAAKEQANYNALAALSGTAFDRQFAMMMVTSHQETVALFEDAASDNGVPDGDLRGYASGKLPTLRDHLKDAQTLQTQVP
jgi:putative membrane protein